MSNFCGVHGVSVPIAGQCPYCLSDARSGPLSRRDHFAAAAMKAIIAFDGVGCLAEAVARDARKFADALIAELDKK